MTVRWAGESGDAGRRRTWKKGRPVYPHFDTRISYFEKSSRTARPNRGQSVISTPALNVVRSSLRPRPTLNERDVDFAGLMVLSTRQNRHLGVQVVLVQVMLGLVTQREAEPST